MPRKKIPPRFVFPDGFIRHYGEGCPVDPDQFVEAIIRTAEGYGSTGVVRARLHNWTAKAHEKEGGLGEVVGYRLAVRGEPAALDLFERF